MFRILCLPAAAGTCSCSYHIRLLNPHLLLHAAFPQQRGAWKPISFPRVILQLLARYVLILKAKRFLVLVMPPCQGEQWLGIPFLFQGPSPRPLEKLLFSHYTGGRSYSRERGGPGQFSIGLECELNLWSLLFTLEGLTEMMYNRNFSTLHHFTSFFIMQDSARTYFTSWFPVVCISVICRTGIGGRIVDTFIIKFTP